MKIGVITYPGTLDDRDAQRAIRLAGGTPVPLWHADDDLKKVDAVVLPGGFSYGDYLRCGAIAAQAPATKEVIRLAEKGLPVLGICNGFQILVESHLLPGGLIRNEKRSKGPAAPRSVAPHPRRGSVRRSSRDSSPRPIARPPPWWRRTCAPRP